MTNTKAITTARAATTAIKRVLCGGRPEGWATATVRSYNAALGEPAHSNVFITGPEALASLAEVPGATKVEDQGSFITITF